MGIWDEIGGAKGCSISIQQIDNKTKVDIKGNVSKEQLEEIKKQYKDADIWLNGEKISGKPRIVELD